MLFTFKSCFIVCLFFLINTESLMTIQKVYDTFSGKKKSIFTMKVQKNKLLFNQTKKY